MIKVTCTFVHLFQMFFRSISPEILERIVSYLDIASALSFIQVNKHIYKTFEKSEAFWINVAKYIGIELKTNDTVDGIKKRFFDWKTGKNHFYSKRNKFDVLGKVITSTVGYFESDIAQVAFFFVSHTYSFVEQAFGQYVQLSPEEGLTFERTLYTDYEQKKQWFVMREGYTTETLSIVGEKCEAALLNRRNLGDNVKPVFKVYKQLDSFGSNHYLFR